MIFGNVRHGNFDRVLGICYLIAQTVGAVLGVIFAQIFSNGKSTKIVLSVDGLDMLKQLFVEILGAFFLVFMYLCSTDEKTKFTKDSAIQTIILAGSQLGAMLLAGTKLPVIRASPVNPAISFGIILINPSAANWKTFWVFMGGPFIGSLLALIFFRFVYKKTTESIDQMEDEEEAEEEDEL
jgi:glycerol uptake facilitator-like aquaporin